MINFDSTYEEIFLNKICDSYIKNKDNRPVSRVFGFDRGTPIDRYYIEQFLCSHKIDIKGSVLEVEDSTYSKKFGAKCTQYNVLSYQSNDSCTIIGDLTNKSSLPENSMDCFICTQTFNVIFDVQAAIEGSYHLLKPGGVILATVAGLSQISRYDMERWGDYWRFTDKSIRMLFEKYFLKNNIKVEIYGNSLSATAFIQGLCTEDIPDKRILDQRDEDYQVLLGIVAKK